MFTFLGQFAACLTGSAIFETYLNSQVPTFKPIILFFFFVHPIGSYTSILTKMVYNINCIINYLKIA